MGHFDYIPRVWIIRYDDNQTWCTDGEQTEEEAIQAAEERRPGHKVETII